jgi:selenocysteine-specific elongation factor
MRRFVIGTAGHVDHGKTTLVRALTGVDTDRLPEEKRRGISIELGFAPLDVGGGLLASIVDVPGHRRLVRAMIAGATGMEAVMLVVAADEGVMPQTREHVAVCELLGVTRALVVVTKSDAVEPELAQLAGDEARALLGARWQAEAVTCSARTGAGLDEVRTALRRMLAALPEPARREHPRLGVDRVFTVRGTGTVVTGTLVAGRISTGDALFVVGERGTRASSARGLHVHDAAVDRAEAPTRLAVNLAGIALGDVRRGDVVTTDSGLGTTTLLDVLVRPGHALARGAAVTVHVGTASTPARVDAVDTVESGAVARLRTARPAAIAGGDRVVLRGGVEGPAGAVVGGGVVLDARPDRRASGAKRRALAAAMAGLDAEVTARALVESAAPRPLARDALGSRFALDAASLARAVTARCRRALSPGSATTAGSRATLSTRWSSAPGRSCGGITRSRRSTAACRSRRCGRVSPPVREDSPPRKPSAWRRPAATRRSDWPSRETSCGCRGAAAPRARRPPPAPPRSDGLSRTRRAPARASTRSARRRAQGPRSCGPPCRSSPATAPPYASASCGSRAPSSTTRAAR